MLKNMGVDVEDYNVAGKGDLTFEMMLQNVSAHHKKEIGLPLKLILQDEFGNIYRNLAMEILGIKNTDVMSLYPGEKLRVLCRYQSPVATAKVLALEVADSSRQIYYQEKILTADIDNWQSVSGDEKVSDEDMVIVYPRDKKTFAPGERVFLKLDFLARRVVPKMFIF